MRDGEGTVRVARVPVRDEYAEDGESVVLLADGRVVALSALATAVRDALAAGPLPLAALAERLVAAFGPPAGDVRGVTTTEGIVHALSDQGLLALVPE